ncbi:unnamed protein product [Caenorhabditis bovis]|uniref:DRBM domain-containing protein n=1 Tax=Caenorhabditis bovis TaxID=2654633 RepID=A0A8S1EI33_9PELO|nr:unnamed protein product [Caenorhabditis bovis]
MQPLKESSSNFCDGKQNAAEVNGNRVPPKEEEDRTRMHPQHWCGQHILAKDSLTNVYNYSKQEEKEKSPMCRVAEIARFNKLRHVYNLLDESGPAHRKLFTVRLFLTETEVYEGNGCSIKKAQQSAAEKAIENTKLPMPPEKPLRKKKSDMLSPPRMLLQVCRALERPDPVYSTEVYTKCPSGPNDATYQECIIPGDVSYQLYPTAVGYVPGPPTVNVNNGADPAGSPPQVLISKPTYITTLNIGDQVLASGFGHSVISSKSDAASKALCLLGPEVKEHLSNISLNGRAESPNEVVINDIPKYKQKSVISDVHEKAHQMKMNVVFEVVQEDGPPHDREYKVRCAFLDEFNQITAEAIGNGRKKKEAQQNACSILLDQLKTIDSNPLFIASSFCRTQKKMTSVQKDQKRKTIVKDKKMDPDYGHQINPVSRLIQVLQTKKQPHPTFQLVGEDGLNRCKEFMIKVTCGEQSCVGSGPNKRLAKRAAAEAMLALIGYVKPLPPPGKSLLKKKSTESTESKILSETADGEAVPTAQEISATPPAETEPKEKLEEVAENNEAESEGGKRRVTFSTEVQACPPPGDLNYPNSEIAPLKMEIVFEGKIRRMKRLKESKRNLTPEQKIAVAVMASEFFEQLEAQKNSMTFDGTRAPAFEHLERIASEFKFGVQYTPFPKKIGCDEIFSLVSLGFDDPMVCHGVGATAMEAEENAALAALGKLKQIAEKPIQTS